MAFGGLFFALKTPLNKLWWIQKLSYPPHFIHGKRWCIQKNPILTHLLEEHLFWDTLYTSKGRKHKPEEEYQAPQMFGFSRGFFLPKAR